MCMFPRNFLFVLFIVFFSDNVNGRIFEFDGEDVTNNTIQSCIELCISQNFTVAGAEFSVCSDSISVKCFANRFLLTVPVL